MNDDERTGHNRQIEDALARGQAALAAGDRANAVRWLDRAHRVSWGDRTIALILASALIGDDNHRASSLFSHVLATADVRDAWLGLATARLLSGDLSGARTALEAALSRHAWRHDVDGLATQIVRAIGAPGWCCVTGDGLLICAPRDRARSIYGWMGRPWRAVFCRRIGLAMTRLP